MGTIRDLDSRVVFVTDPRTWIGTDSPRAHSHRWAPEKCPLLCSGTEAQGITAFAVGVILIIFRWRLLVF